MKIRVTIMSENDKHIPDLSKETIEAIAKTGWQIVLDSLGSDDIAYVESCELVEN